MSNSAPTTSAGDVLRNLVVGLTVSFVALSLGAAFGILSGRGAFAGMISAGIISLITGLLGGTRVQCSGPTAPMSVVTATIVAVAYGRIPTDLPGVSTDHFINLVILLSAGLLLVIAVLRLGRFISLVPNVVISGFMNGIALLIWAGQIEKLFGLGDYTPFVGSLAANLGVAIATLVVICLWPVMVDAWLPSIEHFRPPSSLVALVAVTVGVHLLDLKIGTIELGGSFADAGGLFGLLQSQWPNDWSLPVLFLALPFALQLAALCYLDTLLTSLVVDRMTQTPTRRNQELAAQGVANGVVGLFGGIPGAQATIRSVLVIKEGGTLRLTGIAIGGFVLLEMVLLQDWISTIPQAVFVGILLKVGYDVLDTETLIAYADRLTGRSKPATAIFVGNLEMLIITGTTLSTLIWDLNTAVVAFTAVVFVINRYLRPENCIRDLKPFGHPAHEE
ncbi:MAG: SulP family inorganic anion transporter [Candidatus Latescibacterota bacterium]|nr:SulP family inorganic anion transporter [Candidatus Latescibacterota bacterium]